MGERSQVVSGQEIPVHCVSLIYVDVATIVGVRFTRFTTRSKFAHLFFEISPQTRVSLGSSGFYYSEVSNADVHVFLRDDSNQMQFFLSELMDSFSEAEQSNYLAEGQKPM